MRWPRRSDPGPLLFLRLSGLNQVADAKPGDKTCDHADDSNSTAREFIDWRLDPQSSGGPRKEQ
jgi:hypothetical protein